MPYWGIIYLPNDTLRRWRHLSKEHHKISQTTKFTVACSDWRVLNHHCTRHPYLNVYQHTNYIRLPGALALNPLQCIHSKQVHKLTQLVMMMRNTQRQRTSRTSDISPLKLTKMLTKWTYCWSTLCNNYCDAIKRWIVTLESLDLQQHVSKAGCHKILNMGDFIRHLVYWMSLAAWMAHDWWIPFLRYTKTGTSVSWSDEMQHSFFTPAFPPERLAEEGALDSGFQPFQCHGPFCQFGWKLWTPLIKPVNTVTLRTNDLYQKMLSALRAKILNVSWNLSRNKSILLHNSWNA